MHKSILCTLTKSPLLVNKNLLYMYYKNLIPHHLGLLRGSCSPNAIPIFNGLNAIRNIQMIFTTKANHHFNEKGRTILALSGQIPLWKE